MWLFLIRNVWLKWSVHSISHFITIKHIHAVLLHFAVWYMGCTDRQDFILRKSFSRVFGKWQFWHVCQRAIFSDMHFCSFRVKNTVCIIRCNNLDQQSERGNNLFSSNHILEDWKIKLKPAYCESCDFEHSSWFADGLPSQPEPHQLVNHLNVKKKGSKRKA